MNVSFGPSTDKVLIADDNHHNTLLSSSFERFTFITHKTDRRDENRDENSRKNPAESRITR